MSFTLSATDQIRGRTLSVCEVGGACLGRLAFLFAVCLACWPALFWVWGRWFEMPGYFLGPVVFSGILTYWVCLVVVDRAGRQTSFKLGLSWTCCSAFIVLLFAAFHRHVPRLVSCGLLFLAVAFMMLATLNRETRRRSLAIVPLAVLSLDLSASLQFYLGWPLRVMVGKMTSLMMMKTVEPVGAGLSDGVSTVFIDAPCSGVRMLCSSVLLASLVALSARLGSFRTVALVFAGVVVAVLGNSWRAASLFILETRLNMGSTAHIAIGLIVFVACAVLIVWLGVYLKRHEKQPGSLNDSRPVRQRVCAAVRIVFIVACLLGLAATMVPRGSEVAALSQQSEYDWPAAWEGRPLARVPLDSGTKGFLSTFPGDIAQFRCGDEGTLILLRYCREATRKLHPAEDCYRGSGWKCTPLPSTIDEHGNVWSGFKATNSDGVTRNVRQCYFSLAGIQDRTSLEGLFMVASSWPDVSSWYWAAAKPRSKIVDTIAVTISD